MRTRLLLSLLGLAFGSSILIISLFSATQVASTGGQPASESTFYISNEILPDHSMYKLFMLVDRIELEVASPHEQVFMRVEYANRRLGFTKALLEKDNKPLAGAILLKSQNYLHQAAQGALADDATKTMREHVLKALEYHSEQLKKISPQLDEQTRSQVERVLQENDVLILTLKSKMTQQ